MKTASQQVLILAALCLALLAQSQACALQAVSVADPTCGGPNLGNADTWVVDMTPDGGCVVLLSRANNLVEGMGRLDFVNVFVRNRNDGTIQLVSVNRLGTGAGNGHSSVARISADGRYVVFESNAEDLVTGDVNGVGDVFLRDLVEGRTELISVNAGGTRSGNGTSWGPAITPDGKHVAFVSDAGDLLDGATVTNRNVYVRDVSQGITRRASVGGALDASDGLFLIGRVVISPSGRHVAFDGRVVRSALDAGTSGFMWTVFVRDVVGGQTVWAGLHVEDHTGPIGLPPRSDSHPALSADGAYVTFKSSSATGWLFRYHILSATTELVATHVLNLGDAIEDLSGPVMTQDGRFIVYAGHDQADWTSPSQIFRWDGATGETTLVSVNLEGTGGGNGISDSPRVSSDGGRIWFLSHATDLVEEELAGASQLFVRDVELGTTTLLSQNDDGAPGVHDLVWPMVSEDADLVVFDVPDDGYVQGDRNRRFDAFGRDVAQGAIEVLSLGVPGIRSATGAGPSDLTAASISTDGRHVAFVSFADDLVPGDENGTSDVFVRDVVEQNTTLVSVNEAGTASGRGLSRAPAISSNGRYVAFESWAGDLAPNDSNDQPDVFLRDLLTGTTTLVSINLTGQSTAAGATAPAISGDGRHVAFLSASSDLVGEAPARDNVYVRDLEGGVTRVAGEDRPEWSSWVRCEPVGLSTEGRFVLFQAWIFSMSALYRTDLDTGVTVRVDQPIGNEQAFGPVGVIAASMSPDGRWVAYVSDDSSLVESDSKMNAFLRDLDRGETQLITVNTNGVSGNDHAFEAVVSDDGRWVAFVSAASDLVPNDPHREPSPLERDYRNANRDVFLRDVEAGVTTLISRSAGRDRSGDRPSNQVSLSADGRYVAFRSLAADLVGGGHGPGYDVFLHDRLTGLTQLVSTGEPGPVPANSSSHRPVLSADGTVVVFRSLADNLIGLDFNDSADVFWASSTGAGRLTSFVTDIQAAAGEHVTLWWRHLPGADYQVEFKDSWTSEHWQDLGAPVTVENGWVQAEDLMPKGVANRYYRVRQE